MFLEFVLFFDCLDLVDVGGGAIFLGNNCSGNTGKVGGNLPG